jgi:hypothetical protein
MEEQAINLYVRAAGGSSSWACAMAVSVVVGTTKRAPLYMVITSWRAKHLLSLSTTANRMFIM